MTKPVSEQRSENMRRIHEKDTKIELVLRKILREHGYGYRKNWAELPGKPDIVLTKYILRFFATVNFFTERTGMC